MIFRDEAEFQFQYLFGWYDHFSYSPRIDCYDDFIRRIIHKDDSNGPHIPKFGCVETLIFQQIREIKQNHSDYFPAILYEIKE